MKNNKAFTLVELVVVITVLAILSTIGFVSFHGYSQSARNAVRISDLTNIKKGLELYRIKNGRYPNPTNSSPITYSGGTIWQQGSFGKSTFLDVEIIHPIPTDPLFDKEYSYSLTSDKQKYQLGGIYEGEIFAYNNITNSSYAGTSDIHALVVGNYNGFVAKTINGSTCNVLTVPSIIANGINVSTNYEELVASKSLVMNGFNNLPPTFDNIEILSDNKFDFTPNNVVLYSDNDNCDSLRDSEIGRVDMLKNIQNSYSGTILEDKSQYLSLGGMDINEGSLDNTNEVLYLAGNIGRELFGEEIKISHFTEYSKLFCKIDGKEINDGNNITTYIEEIIDAGETYDCQSISEVRTCTDGILYGDEIYNFSSCLKGEISDCSSSSSFEYNTHTYSVPPLNHSEYLNDIESTEPLISSQVYENNGVYTYTLNNIACNDGVFINMQENIIPTYVKCNIGYALIGGVCTSEGTVDISSGENVVCPQCTL